MTSRQEKSAKTGFQKIFEEFKFSKVVKIIAFRCPEPTK